MGCGGVGLNVVQAARIAGAVTIVAVDIDPLKLELAQQFGATHTIDSTLDEPISALDALTTGGRVARSVVVFS
jgi:Zn-dependent alcohol dehydrogenase